MSSETSRSHRWVSRLRNDFMPSVVVFLVALPLCMGIAIASGVPVAAGLVTGIVGGILVGLLAGAPLQVSGPAAGLTVIIYELVRQHGLENLGIAVLMAGLLQFIAGVFKLGQWFRAVSPAVIKGMLAGIGVLIFASQFHVMVDDSPKGNGLTNLITIPEAIQKGLPWPEFGTVEERENHTEMLRELGTLHNRQVEIREQAGEIVPEFFAHALTDSEKEQLQSLAEEQRKLRQVLSDHIDELNALNGAKAEKLKDATRKALAATQTAAEDLESAQASNIRKSQANADAAFLRIESRLKNHDLAAKVGIFTILVIIGWQTLAPKSWKVIPPPLVAVVAATAVAGIFTLPVLYVEVPPRLLDDLHVPKWNLLVEGDWLNLVKTAVVIAVVASAETLLCATAVDQMHQGRRANYNRELSAQGVGNMACGMFGALPMTGVIVRSAANVQAGGTSRWSAILHGLWLLLFVSVLTAWIRLIPVAALAAMLVYTGYKLVDLASIKKLAGYDWGEVAVYLATVGTIIATDLLKGVIVGFALSAVKLLLTVSRLRVNLETTDELITLNLHGTATFLQLPILADELESIPRRKRVQIVEENLLFIDHACLDLISSWSKQYQASGGEVIVDLEALRGRYDSPRQTSQKTKTVHSEENLIESQS